MRLFRDARGTVSGARVDMGPVTVDERATDAEIDGETWRYHASSVGNPHAVVFTDSDPGHLPVDEVGRAFQALDAFPDGVNVEFVRIVEDGALAQRTFERGSGETLACGSGATAAAIAAIRTGRVAGPRVVVHLRGGDLVVEDLGTSAVLAGPAVTVFAGEMALERKDPGA